MGSRCSRIAIPALSHVQLLPALGASFPVLRAGVSESPLLCVVRSKREQTPDREQRPSPLSVNLIDWAGVHASVETPRCRVPDSRTPRATTRGDIGSSARDSDHRVAEVAQRFLTRSSDQKRLLGEAV